MASAQYLEDELPSLACRNWLTRSSREFTGHSMLSMAFYGLLIWFIWRYETNKAMRRVWCATFAVIIVMVGVSRIYLGVHYASDVIAGFCVSFAWLMFFTRIVAPAADPASWDARVAALREAWMVFSDRVADAVATAWASRQARRPAA